MTLVVHVVVVLVDKVHDVSQLNRRSFHVLPVVEPGKDFEIRLYGKLRQIIFLNLLLPVKPQSVRK